MSKKDKCIETVYKVPRQLVSENETSCIKKIIEKTELTKDGLRGSIFMEPELFHELEVHGRRLRR